MCGRRSGPRATLCQDALGQTCGVHPMSGLLGLYRQPNLLIVLILCVAASMSAPSSMLSSRTVLPRCLVSIAPRLAVRFILNHFALCLRADSKTRA